MLERHLVTPLLDGTAVAALGLAFRLGMGLSGIHQVLRSEGEEVAVALMAVLFLGPPGPGDDRRRPGGDPDPDGTPGALGKCNRRR